MQEATDNNELAAVMLCYAWNLNSGRTALAMILWTRLHALIAVAAGSRQIHPDGALTCLRMLLVCFPNDGSLAAWTDGQLDLALDRARKKGRAQAVMLLESFIAGKPLPAD